MSFWNKSVISQFMIGIILIFSLSLHLNASEERNYLFRKIWLTTSDAPDAIHLKIDFDVKNSLTPFLREKFKDSSLRIVFQESEIPYAESQRTEKKFFDFVDENYFDFFSMKGVVVHNRDLKTIFPRRSLDFTMHIEIVSFDKEKGSEQVQDWALVHDVFGAGAAQFNETIFSEKYKLSFMISLSKQEDIKKLFYYNFL